MLAYFILIFAVLLIIAAAAYAYNGGFYKPEITIQRTGGEVLIYENIKGDYRQSGTVMDKIYYSLLNDDKIETYRGFGVYYDNPQKVEKCSLRSEAGCIIEEKDFDKLSSLEKKYNIRTFPIDKYITTEFPYKNKLSVLFSLMRVYPALNKFADINGYDDSPVVEIYDIPNKKILYRKLMIKK